MNIGELRQRVLRGEDETLELKSGIPRPDAIAQQLAAFANTKGGLLVLGFKEPAEFVGVDAGRAQAALQRAQALLEPRLQLEIETHDVEGKTVIAVHVPAMQGLVASSGGYYRRAGQQFRPMRADEIQSHAQQGKSRDAALHELSAAVAAQTATIDKLREDFRKANSLPLKIAIAVGGALVGLVGRYLLEAIL